MKSKLSLINEEDRNPEIFKEETPFDLHEMLKDESEDEEEQLNYELDTHFTSHIALDASH